MKILRSLMKNLKGGTSNWNRLMIFFLKRFWIEYENWKKIEDENFKKLSWNNKIIEGAFNNRNEYQNFEYWIEENKRTIDLNF